MIGTSASTSPPHLVVDDFLSPDESDGLLEWTLHNRERFQAATVNGVVEQKARVSLSLRDLGPFAELFRTRALERSKEWISALNVTPFEPSRCELELVAHNHGSFFTLHGDTYHTGLVAAEHRMLSAVFYFHRQPAGFFGGELRLHQLGAKPGDAGRDVPPVCGRMVIFPSWWPHEVRPVYCGSAAFADSRFSVNCWIYRSRNA